MRSRLPFAARALVVLASACSAPDTVEPGFISLGHDDPKEVGGSGAVSGAPASSGSAGIGGTAAIPPSEGGVTGVTGGTSTGAAPASCGSGGMPALPDRSVGGGAILAACEQSGPNERICIADDVWYCGENTGGLIEQCDAGTCASGCCHAIADPCASEYPVSIDCSGDCGGEAPGVCDRDPEAPSTDVVLEQNGLALVRVGPNAPLVRCSDPSRRRLYFEILLFGPDARVTVSPPWTVDDFSACPGDGGSRCLVSKNPTLGAWRAVLVSADASTSVPPPRNVVIETSEAGSTCP